MLLSCHFWHHLGDFRLKLTFEVMMKRWVVGFILVRYEFFEVRRSWLANHTLDLSSWVLLLSNEELPCGWYVLGTIDYRRVFTWHQRQTFCLMPAAIHILIPTLDWVFNEFKSASICLFILFPQQFSWLLLIWRWVILIITSMFEFIIDWAFDVHFRGKGLRPGIFVLLISLWMLLLWYIEGILLERLHILLDAILVVVWLDDLMLEVLLWILHVNWLKLEDLLSLDLTLKHLFIRLTLMLWMVGHHRNMSVNGRGEGILNRNIGNLRLLGLDLLVVRLNRLHELILIQWYSLVDILVDDHLRHLLHLSNLLHWLHWLHYNILLMVINLRRLHVSLHIWHNISYLRLLLNAHLKWDMLLVGLLGIVVLLTLIVSICVHLIIYWQIYIIL